MGNNTEKHRTCAPKRESGRMGREIFEMSRGSGIQAASRSGCKLWHDETGRSTTERETYPGYLG